MPRGAEFKGQIVRVVFQRPPPAACNEPREAAAADARRTASSGSSSAHSRATGSTLDAPVLTSLDQRRAREAAARRAVGDPAAHGRRRCSPSRIAASTSIPGVDPIGIVGAVFSYATGGKRAYLAGGSTHHPAAGPQRVPAEVRGHDAAGGARAVAEAQAARDVRVARADAARASKDEILEMYLNDVPLGQRGSFAIFGVAEASRLFFGKDVSNVSLAEAATIAGVIQSPSALSPFNNPARCRERRNVVLQAMADAGYITPGGGRPRRRRSRWPSSSARSKPKRRTSSTTSARRSPSSIPGLTTTTNQAVDVYTTLDLHLQRLAQDAVRDGLTKVDQLLSRRKRQGQRRGGADRRRSADRRDSRVRRRPLVQPVAVQPRHRRRAGSRDRSSSRSST